MTDETPTPSADRVPTTPGKVDPESVALRVQPTKAVRFRRGAIVALAGLGSLSLIGTSWFALRTSSPMLAGQTDAPQLPSKPPPEVANALPANYGQVPQLGPPLPGDLGRPILEHQRAMAAEPPAAQTNPAEQAAAMERDRRTAELRSARESGLLVQSQRRIDVATDGEVAPLPAPAAANTAGTALNFERDPNAQQRKAEFIATRDAGGDVNAGRLAPPISPNMLSAGSVISASLITGLRSDLPGLVTAQVTERVFDSATGTILLIPQGARLIGTYDSVVAFGQRRALVVWQRIILPDGSSVRLDNVPATDPSGYAGLEDKVDLHTWTLLKGVAISTLLGIGANLTFSGESDLVQAIRESTQANVARAGDQITSRNLNIQPTITVRPGAAVRLIVHRDLILAPWRT